MGVDLNVASLWEVVISTRALRRRKMLIKRGKKGEREGMVCQRKTSEVLSVAEGKLQSDLGREGEMGHLETMLFFVDQTYGRETKVLQQT